MADDLFSQPAPRTNVPELSVSELALSLKKTLEDTYGRVRVRGELSQVKFPASGHMYADLKDRDACLAVICWKGTVPRLSMRPEDGLEVICTGRITTYPARSNYQLIVESMELAGEGALLKMLEDRRKRLAAEGLFDRERKKVLPFLPEVIGVVTSPTGAVIRDILHRLEDRFPRHVLVWPVLVQGAGAADQVAAAIRGFDAIAPGGRIPRPDLMIVARGGGSLEDLMAFNEEQVVRTIAGCRIPVISAIGHETDTTLADYAADMRAPTPTAAAEMAVPVRRNLYAQILDDEERLVSGIDRVFLQRRERMYAASVRLGDPMRMLESRMQRLDHAAHKLSGYFDRSLRNRETMLLRAGGRLLHPQASLHRKQAEFERNGDRLKNVYARLIDARQRQLLHKAGKLRSPVRLVSEKASRLSLWTERLSAFPTSKAFVFGKGGRLEQARRMLDSLSYASVLQRGFVVVRNAAGQPVTEAARTGHGQALRLEFRDGIVEAVVDGKT